MKLDELVVYSRDITDKIIAAHGEITPEIEAELEQVEHNLALKVDKYNYVMERLDLESKYWKDKAALYQKISKFCTTYKDALKARIKQAMQAMQQNEIEGYDYKFKLVGGGETVEFENEEQVLNDLPGEYLKEEITYKIDKKLLLEDLKQGHHFEGCTIKPIISLRIYPRKDTK